MLDEKEPTNHLGAGWIFQREEPEDRFEVEKSKEQSDLNVVRRGE